MFDVIIIGGGPAAVAAGVYAARKQLKTLLVAETLAGQSVVSATIENWIGEKTISGLDLATKMAEHVRAYADVLTIKEGERATQVKKISAEIFEVSTTVGVHHAKTVIVASGARRRKLGVPGEEELNGRGVAYCSTCDAPLYRNKVVAIVGGGNAGLEGVQDLLPYAQKIYLLVYDDAVSGDGATFAEVKDNPKLEVLYQTEILEIKGSQLVEGLVYKHRQTGEISSLPVQGVFVEIGSVPNSEIVQGVVDIDEHGQIITDMKFATTSCPGLFAAGDVTDDPFKQNNISVGDGVRAALSAYDYLRQKTRQSPAAEMEHHGR